MCVCERERVRRSGSVCARACMCYINERPREVEEITTGADSNSHNIVDLHRAAETKGRGTHSHIHNTLWFLNEKVQRCKTGMQGKVAGSRANQAFYYSTSLHESRP